MRRWFLSYHSPDQALAERLKAALEQKDTGAHVFLAPSSLRAGGFWSRALAKEIAQADVFILLVGVGGVGRWQELEYDEALDKRVRFPDFPCILVLLEGQAAPGLPFLRRLHWIITSDPSSEKDVARLLDAASGRSTRPGELWRGAQAPSLARGCRYSARVAARLAGEPPLVLPHAQARDRAAQGAGRIVSRYLAAWRDRSGAGETAEWLDRAVARRQGHATRSARRHRAPLQGTGSGQAPRVSPLYRPGRGAVRARRGAPAPPVFGGDRAGCCRSASVPADEHAFGFSRRAAERRTALQGAFANRCAAAARAGAARGREPASRTALGTVRARSACGHHYPTHR